MILHAVSRVAQQQNILVLIRPRLHRREDQQGPYLGALEQAKDLSRERTPVLIQALKLLDIHLFGLLDDAVHLKHRHDIQLSAA